MERQFVESIKRLFDKKAIDEKDIQRLLTEKKITDAEKKYILNIGE